MNNHFWQGKRVLVTGHTGFKGAWLSLWLRELGAEVCGIALPADSPALFSLTTLSQTMNSCFVDIRDAQALADAVLKLRPEIVFHLAAQALVRPSYQYPLETFACNVMGTANLLNALRDVPNIRTAVIVTTDKVYRNREWEYPYRENDPLGGYDPYSASKAASEIIIDSFRSAFLKEQGVAVASARAGNVIGGGDWAKDRLIPDAIRAWQAHKPLEIRRPHAIRPWQHILEPLYAYLTLAEQLWERPELAGSYNFGPSPYEAASVGEVIQMARQAYGKGEIFLHSQEEGPHEARLLRLDISRAQSVLGLAPRWGLEQSVGRTMHWYRKLASGQSAEILCSDDITAYTIEGDMT